MLAAWLEESENNEITKGASTCIIRVVACRPSSTKVMGTFEGDAS